MKKQKRLHILPHIDYGRVIVGFHGTDRKTARQLCDGLRFNDSHNDYDWLGTGIYFWEFAPLRAWEWARERYPKSPTVVAALIRLGNCFDLLEPRNYKYLFTSYKNITQKNPELKNTPKAHRLDCAILNEFLDYSDGIGITFETVRGAFIESLAHDIEPLWPGSGIIKDLHVQLSVRGCVRSLFRTTVFVIRRSKNQRTLS